MKHALAVGDKVEAILIDEKERQEVEAYIYSLEARKNMVCRANFGRMQILGANVDLIALFCSVNEPPFRHRFIDRVLVEAISVDVTPIIVLNKCDLLKPNEPSSQNDFSKKDPISNFLKHYQKIGIQIFREQLKDRVSHKLKKTLSKKRVILIGQSGVGKSTLINQIFGEEKQLTAEVGVNKKGRHTTTNPKMYKTDTQGELIDAPGIKEFGLQHRNVPEILSGFKELRSFSCRFEDCSHLHEPGCEAIASLKKKDNSIASIPEWRYNSYSDIVSSLKSAYKMNRGNYLKN